VASEIRYSEAKKILEDKGFSLRRISGSHHVFKKPGGGMVSLPVHKGKVKAVYVRQIKKI
jgi:predicted RNA binding protein YcfA (HicA-like mRNA interferase family)